MSFVIIASDNIYPKLIAMEMTSINRTNATLTVELEEPMHFYYMIGKNNILLI